LRTKSVPKPARSGRRAAEAEETLELFRQLLDEDFSGEDMLDA
jgi:hypothetical protein